MDGNPQDFAKQLRASVQTIAKSAVDEALRGLQDTLAKAADMSAQEAVRKAAESLRADTLANQRFQDRVIEQMQGKIDHLQQLLKAFDHDAAQSVLKAVRHEQEALRRQQAEIEADHSGLKTMANRVHILAKLLVDTDTDHTTALAKTAATLETLLQTTDERASAAAQQAVESLTAATIAKAGEAQTEAHGRAMATLDAWQASADAAVVKMRDEAATLSDELILRADSFLKASADEATPLVPRAYRGPFKDGAGYQRGDLVTYLGSTWISVKKNDIRPMVMTEDGAPWQLFAAGGVGGVAAKRAPKEA